MLILGGAVLLSLPSAQAAGDPARGKELHDAHCTSCHAKLMDGNPTAIFTRPNRIVRSLDGLNKRVRFCESMNGLNWKDQDIDDVVAYLNQAFYKFGGDNP
ncbi:MAG: cytochrome c [Pseudomonadota bacterium]